MGQDSANVENISFEDALTRLETLVDSLESGDIPLADLVEKYEEGSSLLNHCNRKLTNAELKIEQLRQESEGNDAEKPAQ